MLTARDNATLTQVGPGTPMGELMRQFWIPAVQSVELPEPDCPPVRVKLLGEELVTFRDTNGDVGMLDNYCSIDAPASSSDATRKAVCAASTTAGSTT